MANQGTKFNRMDGKMYTVNVNRRTIWQSERIVNGADQLLITAGIYLENGGADYTQAQDVVLALDGVVIRHSTRDRTPTIIIGPH